MFSFLVIVLAVLQLASSPIRTSAIPFVDFPPYGPNTSYPISGQPLADYDINRNWIVFNSSSVWWWPRSFDLSQYNLNVTWTGDLAQWAVNVTDFQQGCNNLQCRTLDTTRGVYRLLVSNGRKLYLPFDVRKSVQPVFTAEYFVSLGSIGTNSVKLIWSADLTNTPVTSGTVHAPSIAGYDPSGCGSYVHAYGPTPQTSCKLPVGAGFVHYVAIFDQTNNNVTVVVNGRFYESRTMATVDGLPGIAIGGRLGVNTYDVSSQTLVSFRVWPRKLSLTEILAVNADWYYLYTRPVFTSPYPFAVFPSPFAPAAPTITVAVSCSLSNPNYTIYRNERNGAQTFVATGSVATASTQFAGNYSYTAVFKQCYYPSTSYSTFWGIGPSMCTWATNTTVEVYTGISAISPLITAWSTNKAAGYPDQVARLQYRVVFNRQIREGMMLPLNQPVYSGSGYSMIDNFPNGTLTGAIGNGNISWTRLSDTVPVYMFAFDAKATRPPTTASVLFPSAPSYLVRDFDGVPMFGGPWGSPTYSVILGITANMTQDPTDVKSQCDGTLLVGFQLSFSYAVSSLFNPTNDVIPCAGCSVDSVSQTSALRYVYFYWIQTPDLTNSTGFNVTLSLNNASVAGDASYTWNSLSVLIAQRGPVSATVQVDNTTGSGLCVSSSSSTAGFSSSSSSALSSSSTSSSSDSVISSSSSIPDVSSSSSILDSSSSSVTDTSSPTLAASSTGAVSSSSFDPSPSSNSVFSSTADSSSSSEQFPSSSSSAAFSSSSSSDFSSSAESSSSSNLLASSSSSGDSGSSSLDSSSQASTALQSTSDPSTAEASSSSSSESSTPSATSEPSSSPSTADHSSSESSSTAEPSSSTADSSSTMSVSVAESSTSEFLTSTEAISSSSTAMDPSTAESTGGSSSASSSSSSLPAVDSSSSLISSGVESSSLASTSSSDATVSSSSSSVLPTSSSEPHAVSSTSSISVSSEHSSSSSSHATSSGSSLPQSSSMAPSSSTPASTSSQPVISLSSMLQPRDQCAEYYAEEYLGVALEVYVASLPPGSTRINFVLTGATIPLPRNFDLTFGSDIALNVAFMLDYDEQDAEAITSFIDVASVGGCVTSTASRRLLTVSNGDLTLSAFILGNVSEAVPGFTERLSAVINETSSSVGPKSVTERLGLALEQRLAAGAFVTPTTAINITGTEILPVELIFSSTGVSGGVADDTSASSFEWTDGRIAGVVIGCVIGFMLILVAILCVFRQSKQSDKVPSKSKTEMPIYWTGVQSVMPVHDDQYGIEFKY